MAPIHSPAASQPNKRRLKRDRLDLTRRHTAVGDLRANGKPAGVRHPRASSSSGFADGYREWRELIARALAEAAADGELPAGLHYRHEADRLGTLLAGLGLLSGTDLATSPRFHDRARRMVDEHLASLTSQRTEA